MSYRVARLEEIEVMDDGRCPWRPVRHHLGINAFGVNAWTARDAGDRIINEHTEEGEDEELYVVLEGRATFQLDGESVDAPAGTLVFARPGVKRTAFAEEAGTTLLALGATRGKAYEPMGWEIWVEANRYYQAGDYERAIEVAKPIVGEYPQYSAPVYNLACCESLSGRTDDALEHLRRAIDVQDGLRELARGDSDFDPIREDPRFVELVGTTPNGGDVSKGSLSP
jgi:mannose-6-phosphate isomerase-like protein (cupin superfamily)